MTITSQLTYLKQKLVCELTQLIDNYAAEVAGLVSVPADDSLRVAMIQAECALADIAEGEETNSAPNTFQWAEQRCAEALASIRPMMKLRDIPTSETEYGPIVNNQPSSESMPAAKTGLYAKYTVQHTDGALVDFPSFVLRIDGTDPAALAALLAYANHPDCSTQLAADLIKKFNQAVKLNPPPLTTKPAPEPGEVREEQEGDDALPPVYRAANLPFERFMYLLQRDALHIRDNALAPIFAQSADRIDRAIAPIQQQATELAALRSVPTTVEQQPWKKPGWCDSEGRCWWFNDESCAGVRVFANKGEYPVHSRMLPHNAISLPEQFNREF